MNHCCHHSEYIKLKAGEGEVWSLDECVYTCAAYMCTCISIWEEADVEVTLLKMISRGGPPTATTALIKNREIHKWAGPLHVNEQDTTACMSAVSYSLTNVFTITLTVTPQPGSCQHSCWGGTCIKDCCLTYGYDTTTTVYVGVCQHYISTCLIVDPFFALKNDWCIDS